jgi:8-oxo-dGTP diphosphatase
MRRYKIINTVHLFIESDGKILLSLRKNTGYADGMYSLIGGHVEENETIKEALKREVKEEIGVALFDSDIELIHVMHRKKENESDDDRVEFYFKSNISLNDIHNMEENYCAKLEWFDSKNLPLNTVPYIRYFIEQIHLKKNYSEYGW